MVKEKYELINALRQYDFINALKEYNHELTNRLIDNYLAIYTHSKLFERRNNLSDILLSNKRNNLLDNISTYKDNFILNTSYKIHSNLREIKEGVALITHKGIYFFVINYAEMIATYKEPKLCIAHHEFFPFEQFPKLNVQKKIVLLKPFTIKGAYPDNRNEEDCHYSLPLDYETFKAKSIKNQKMATKIVCLTISLLILSFVFIPRATHPYPYQPIIHSLFALGTHNPIPVPGFNRNPRYNRSPFHDMYYRNTTSFFAYIETDVLRINFWQNDIWSSAQNNAIGGYFVGATIANDDGRLHNSRMFLLEVTDLDVDLEVGQKVHITAVGQGAIINGGFFRVDSVRRYLTMQVETMNRRVDDVGEYSSFLRMRATNIEIV